MSSERQEEQASLYVVGAMADQERQAFEAELAANPELRKITGELQAALGLVVRAHPSPPLPPNLKGKVLARIDALPGGAAGPPPASGGLNFLLAADQKDWKPLPVPGASVKLLSLERERGYAILLGKLERGARYPAHRNTGPEDFYILSGDLFIGERQLRAGDFHHADAGSWHEENYSGEGCTLLAVLTIDDPLVALAAA